MTKRQIPETDDLIPFDLDRKYTVKDIAEQADRSTKTVRKWITTRKLKAYDFGRGFIITATDWNVFADANKLRFLYSWLGYDNAAEIDPAYEPPKPTEVNIDDLTDEQLNAAIIIPPMFERFDASVLSKKLTTNDQDILDADERRWFRDWMDGITDE